MWSKKLGKTRRNLALLGAFVLVTLLGALVLTAGLVVAVYKRGGFELPDGFFRSRNNPLDGCYHVYLDVGSNIGIQVRKLYEPHLFTGAFVQPLFDEHFRRRYFSLNSTLPLICTVGFEPNPRHKDYLEGLSKAYKGCGWNVQFHTQTAVSDVDGEGSFFSDRNLDYFEWDGSIRENTVQPDVEQVTEESNVNKTKPVLRRDDGINLVRLSKYINEVVGTRIIPDGVDAEVLGRPKVLMKMDIEGTEVEVLPDLISSGSLKFIDVLMAEFHETITKSEDRKQAITRVHQTFNALGLANVNVGGGTGSNDIVGFKTQMLNFDDETFFKAKYPFPNCSHSVTGYTTTKFQ